MNPHGKNRLLGARSGAFPRSFFSLSSGFFSPGSKGRKRLKKIRHFSLDFQFPVSKTRKRLKKRRESSQFTGVFQEILAFAGMTDTAEMTSEAEIPVRQAGRSLGKSLFLLILTAGGCFAGGFQIRLPSALSAQKEKPPVEGERVGRVRVRGNRLIDSALIFSHLRLRANRPYRSSLVRKDVHRLFSLGFFKEVEVHARRAENGQLNITYLVRERPVIHSVEFKGNKNMSRENLKELLTVKEFDFLNFDRLEETLSKVKEKYREKGYFFIELSYKTIPVKEKKGVKLIIQIEEKRKTRIAKINFIGNRNIPASVLKRHLLLREHSLLGALSSSGIYNPEHLNRDRQVIEYLYRDKGYLQVRLEQPEISITPDQTGVHITFPIIEGRRFRVGEVEFQEDPPVSQKDVKGRLALKKGEWFSLGALRTDLQFVSGLYKDKGYAFARPEPRIAPDPAEENTVHILLTVQKGKVYQLGRIEVEGNKKTRDKVILRQFSLKEGETYNESKKQRSKALIQRLGFFEEVDLRLKKGSPGETDIHVKLKEREDMGEAQLAAGYNTISKWLIRGGVRNNNFLGLGRSLSIQLDLGQFQEMFNFNYTDPWFLDSDWSLSLDLFNVGRDQNSFGLFSDRQSFSYSQLRTGTAFSLGRPFSDFSSVFLKYTLQRQEVFDDGFAFFIRKLPGIKGVYEFLFGEVNPSQTVGFNTRFPIFSDIYPPKEGNGVNSFLSGTFQYDRRNDRIRPSAGHYGSLSLEYSGLGGDFDYTRISGTFYHYQKLFWDLVLKNSFNFGFVESNKRGARPPFTELFLLGGPNSLRGFRIYSVGRRKRSQQAFEHAQRTKHKNPSAFAWRPYGGSRMFYYNLELQAPLLRHPELKGILFFDVGEANDSLTFSFHRGVEEGFGLRADVGFGLKAWLPVLGPVRLDWGFPLKPQRDYEEAGMELQFTMGSGF